MRHVQKMLLFLFHAAEWCVIASAMTLIVLMLFGIHSYAVRTGSMQPTILAGSICFVNQRVPFEEIREGDIIAFKAGEILVTHRAVRIEPDGITTKGDANNTEDAMKISGEQYIGKTIFWIPYLGELLLSARTQKGRSTLAGGLVIFILVGFLENKISNQNEKGKQKK